MIHILLVLVLKETRGGELGGRFKNRYSVEHDKFLPLLMGGFGYHLFEKEGYILSHLWHLF